MSPIDVTSLANRLETIESLVYLETVTSTNLLARRVMSECSESEISLPEAMIIAGEQTGGRGRGSRTWSSPPDKGIYATILHHVSSEEFAVLPLRVATILASYLRETFGIDAGIKWPNDILVDGRKIAGILIEARNSGDGAHVIIGVGVNIFEGETPATAVSVAELSKREHVELDSAIEAFVEHFDQHLGESIAPNAVIAEWKSLAVHKRGDRVTCVVGDRTIEGTWDDIDDNGRALIKKGPETIPVSAGDLTLSEDN